MDEVKKLAETYEKVKDNEGRNKFDIDHGIDLMENIIYSKIYVFLTLVLSYTFVPLLVIFLTNPFAGLTLFTVFAPTLIALVPLVQCAIMKKISQNKHNKIYEKKYLKNKEVELKKFERIDSLISIFNYHDKVLKGICKDMQADLSLLKNEQITNKMEEFVNSYFLVHGILHSPSILLEESDIDAVYRYLEYSDPLIEKFALVCKRKKSKEKNMENESLFFEDDYCIFEDEVNTGKYATRKDIDDLFLKKFENEDLENEEKQQNDDIEEQEK